MGKKTSWKGYRMVINLQKIDLEQHNSPKQTLEGDANCKKGKRERGKTHDKIGKKKKENGVKNICDS